MPVRTVPEWMRSDVQPIAITDVVEALLGALTVDTPSRHYDVGGPTTLPYPELLDVYADVAGLERPQVMVPLLPTQLVGSLLGALIDVPSPTVGALELGAAAGREALAHVQLVLGQDIDADLARLAHLRPAAGGLRRAEGHEGRVQRQRRHRLAGEAVGLVAVEGGDHGDARAEIAQDASQDFRLDRH